VLAVATSDVADGAGGATSSWQPVATLWANVQPGVGREFWEQKKLTPALSHIVELRYYSGLTPAMRFVYGTRVFKILAAIDPDETQTTLQCFCEEEVTT
jgi:SPP1 family predicted phage head-tail adaptor